jgi:hypothetical protein
VLRFGDLDTQRRSGPMPATPRPTRQLHGPTRLTFVTLIR